jgi:hypothetical protein
MRVALRVTRLWKTALLLAGVWTTSGCKPERPDVLQEFPPPRLAKLALHVTQRTHTMSAQCDGELSLRTRLDAVTRELKGATGMLTLSTNGKTELTGSLSVPFPPGLSLSSTEPPPLRWRIVETKADTGIGAWSTQVIAELEYNRVRTRAVHSLEFKPSTEPDMPPSEVHLARLALDPNAHRLTMPNEQQSGRPTALGADPLKRADLTLHCRLEETDRSQP